MLHHMGWLRRERARVSREAIEATLRRNVGLSKRLPADLRERMIELTDALLREKTWEGVGLDLTDDMRITVAANAAVPILAHDTYAYRQVKAILVRRSSALSQAVRSGPVAGTFTDDPVHLVGEATPNTGPVVVAWDTAVYESRHPHRGANVVIHEFAHKIDMADGYADGVPPLRGEALDRWVEVLDDEYRRVGARESDEVLRDYAWTSPAEFFAVSTEVFFCRPTELAAAKPVLYERLSELYALDPAGWAPAEG